MVFAVFTLKVYLENSDKLKAFDQCIEDISNKCSSTIGYAILLEKENARLNKLKKECRDNAKRRPR